VIHTASSRFWVLYEALPKDVRENADKNFQLLKSDSRHPSLHFKRIGAVWSVRVDDRYRALGHEVTVGIQWFWFGSHADYDKIVG
jgi:hypothetical protein